jgi:hypothetical protein
MPTGFPSRKGTITESGTHHQLLEMKGLYYAMWRQQIGERKRIASNGSGKMLEATGNQ